MRRNASSTNETRGSSIQGQLVNVTVEINLNKPTRGECQGEGPKGGKKLKEIQRKQKGFCGGDRFNICLSFHVRCRLSLALIKTRLSHNFASKPNAVLPVSINPRPACLFVA